MAASEGLPELTVEFESVDALQKEFAANLKKGRAFAAGATGVEERGLCKVVLVHPDTGSAHSVRAEAVWIKSDEPGAGIGVQFLDFDGAAVEQLEWFVQGGLAVLESLAPPESQPPPTTETASNVDAAETNPGAREAATAADDAETEDAGAEDSEERGERKRGPRNIHEKVRAMGMREQQQVARSGGLTERVALERAYGSSIWEFLLQNPNLTVPEVARISKKGSLPKPLVNVIVANGAWLSSPEVQRALLSNPRVGGAHLDRVLRTMPQNDLQRVSRQTAYRPQVRSAAKRLLQKK